MRALPALVLVAACGGSTSPGPGPDAAVPDAALPDAAAPDAGPADAGFPDGATNPARLWLAPRTSDRDLILAESEPPPF
jgi:hypothetical protein